MRARGIRFGAAVAGAVLVAGCLGPAGGDGSGATLTVLAAASLTEVFTDIGQRFEAAHPGTAVTLSFGSSALLASQIRNGAPGDVYAAASEATMRSVTDAGLADDPTVFASNTMQIAVPRGNPAGVQRLADFAMTRHRIALCAEQVPCGSAALRAFAVAGVTPRPDTWDSDVKAVLQKVATGEVDAGLVYRTDVRAAGERVQGISFPEAADAVTRYPIAVLASADAPDLARAFVEHVRSEQSSAVLAGAGFGPP